MPRQFQALTDDMLEHFMEYGYCVVKQASTRQQAQELAGDVWIRLGMNPNDQSTWTKERINMPDQHAYDALIVNLGIPEYAKEETPHPRDLDNWHCDGDFFRHFLDSPEQGLLTIPLWSDIIPRAGGTMVAPDGIEHVVRFLAAHPDGVMGGDPSVTNFDFRDLINKCKVFHEMTGEVGDVVLIHPLMLHSASHNNLRIPRIITNPPVSLREPFNFKRSNPANYSPVELKTIKALGSTPEEGYEFTPTGPRQRIVPEREKVQSVMKVQELKRLQRQRGVTVGA